MNNDKFYDNFLLEKRGWVSKIPDNKICVFVFSGGLDSISTIARVIKDFNFIVYPLFIDIGQTNIHFEENSVDYFNNLFLNLFPNNYNQVKKIVSDIPNNYFKQDLQAYMKIKGYPLRDTFIEMLAVQYAITLSDKINKYIKTIFTANVIDDPFPHCTLQSMRSTTINICQNLDDWEWQITSPNIDTCFSEKYFGKVDEINFCFQNNIPIEKSISCYKPIIHNNLTYHCGECLACIRRKQAFIDAKVNDLTLYINK